MFILFKKMLRDLKEAAGQFASIILVIILGVMIYTGFNSTYRDLSLASGKFMSDYRFADLFCTFTRAPESILTKIEALPYVKAAEGRVVQQVKIDMQGNNADLRIITIPDVKRDNINGIVIKEGKYFNAGASNQCLLEEGFYKEYGLKPGDAIVPVINGRKVKLLVCGSVRSPEYVYPLKGSGELMADNSKFGIAYIKESFGKTIFGFNGALNNVSILLRSGVGTKEARDDIKRELEANGLAEVIRKEDQISNSMLNEEMKSLSTMGSITPIVFFIVAAVIIYIMMGRMVENQRTQIGVLKALGYTNFQVLMHYLSFSAFIGIAGSIAGSIFGVFLGRLFTSFENEYFNLPLSDMKIYPDLALPASAITLAFCLFAGYRSCRKVLGIMPGEAMRQKAPPAGRRTLLEKIPGLWSRLGYDWKMILRNIFRYKRRTLLTSVGVIFCVAILMLAFCLNDSVNFVIDQQYRNMQDYDIKITLTKFINVSGINDIKNIRHVSAAEPVIESGIELSNGWIKKTVGYTALDRNPEIYKVVDKTGKSVAIPAEGVLIPEKLAKTLDVNIGDSIEVKPLLPGLEKKKTVVKGIVAEYIGTNAFSSIEGTAGLFGEGEIMNAAVLKLDDPAYRGEVMDILEEMPLINSVQSGTDALESLLKNMGAVTVSIGFIIFLAAVLSIAVVYNIATINIFERKKELAAMKVLGFKDMEVRNLIFNENYLITAFGILLGLPAGKLLCTYIMRFYETDFYSFPVVFSIWTYLITVVLTLLFTVFANLILRRKIRYIDMVSVLKSNE